MVAWLLAGLIAGVALIGLRTRAARGAWPGRWRWWLLLLASQAAYALARNLRFSDVVFSRRPGLGPVLEALVFARRLRARCPGASRGDRRERVGALAGSVTLDGLGQPHLSGGEHRDAAEHDRDREPVGDERRRARA